MDRKRLYALSLPLCFLANSIGYTAPVVPHPQKCPDISDIQAVGVSHNAAQDTDGLWFTGRRSQIYHTGSAWTFVIGKITATTVNDAYSKATTGLSTLAFALGPVMGPVGKWVCYYRTGLNGYPAVAVYPPIALNNALEQLQQ